MAFDFPNAPTVGQQVTAGGNVVYTWDGAKWASKPAAVAAPGGVLVAATPPVAVPNTMWWDSVGGQLYVYYDDGNTVQWVPATSSTPLNAASKADVATALNDVGRNLVHNPLFNIAQRGTGPFTTANAYSLDRWKLNFSLDTMSVIQANFGDAGRTQLGDEAAAVQLQNTFTGNAGAGAYNFLTQAIEGLRRLAGKTVTVSLWAKATAGTPKLGINIMQTWGTGGSPTGASWALATGNAVTLSTTWARYSTTIAIPSASGTTLGTNNDDCTVLAFWFSAGATQNAVAGNIGVQSGAVQLWGVQLEVSPVATPLEKPDPQQDLAKCQRFYQGHGQVIVSGFAPAGFNAYGDFTLPVTMRAQPTVVFANTTYGNASALTVGAAWASHVRFTITVTAQAVGYALSDLLISADL